MKKSYLLIVLLFSSYLLSANEYQAKTIQVDNTTRNYVIKYPDNYQKGQKLPLLIALHGGGSTWKKFTNGTTKKTIQKQANMNGYLLILPEGKNNHWNDGRNKNIAESDRYNDIKFISLLIDKSISEYLVDADKIFITGMSNGGFMAIRLAIELSDKLKAVSAVAAQMSYANKNLVSKEPISFLLINGTDDPVVPFNGGEMKLFKFSKSRGYIMSTAKTIEYFVKNSQCSNSVKTSFQNKRKFDKTTVTSKSYQECFGQSQVKLVQINGGGHTWPGGKQYLPEKIIGIRSREINASKLMLDFFNQVSQ